MADVYTKTDIEKRLEKKQSDINSHLDDLKTGVESVGRDVVDEMRKRPLVYALGGLAIGILLGLLLRGRRKKPSNLAEAYTDLIDRYMDDVVEEAAHLMNKKGKSAKQAISHVVRDRGPVFVYAPETKKKKEGSMFKDLFMAAAMPLLQTGVSRAASLLGEDPDDAAGKVEMPGSDGK